MCGQARAREEELRRQLEASEKQTSEQAEIIRREKIVDAGEKMMLKLHHKLVRRHSDPTVAFTANVSTSHPRAGTCCRGN